MCICSSAKLTTFHLVMSQNKHWTRNRKACTPVLIWSGHLGKLGSNLGPVFPFLKSEFSIANFSAVFGPSSLRSCVILELYEMHNRFLMGQPASQRQIKQILYIPNLDGASRGVRGMDRASEFGCHLNLVFLTVI